MRVNPSEEYGLRCLLRLADERSEGNPLSLQEIAEREGLPLPNTAKLLRRLRLAGFVTSTRGRSGGYMLSRPPDEITLSEVMIALDGPFFQTGRDCSSFSGVQQVCVNTADCSVRSLWGALETLVRGALEKVTLADLASTERGVRARLGDAWKDDSQLQGSWSKKHEE